MRKLLLLLFLSCPALAQMDFSKVEIKATKVAGSVYMLEGIGGFAGGNIGVSVGDDGIVIVDDQFSPLAEKIREALKGISDKPVRFVLNTHYHGDHTDGNRVWGEHSTIIAQTNVRKRLELKPANPQQPPMTKTGLPVITFDHDVTVHLNGEDITALHYPSGHTDGDSVIYFTQSNVVHMGDDFFNGVYPFIDLKAGGSVKGEITAVEAVIAKLKPDTRVIAGHGPLGTVEDLKKYRDMLADCAALVDAAIKQGKTLDQMKQEKILAKYDKWSWQFLDTAKFTEQVYRSLTGQHENVQL